MPIQKEFEANGQRYLYRIQPQPKPGHLYAELRILRREEALGDLIYAQPQLISYKGPGKESVIDSMFREQAEKHFGLKIPK